MRNQFLDLLSPVRRLARAATRRLASEAGFAVPTVLLMTVAALGMAGVAVSTSIQGQTGTVRDQQTKTALAVAESGVEQALLHFNRYGLVSGSTPCAPLGASADAEGWCGPITGAPVNGGTVSYWVRPTGFQPPSGEFAWTDLEIVSVGTFGGVTRRVHVTGSSSSGRGMFVDAAVKAEDGIKLDKNSEIHAGAATNGDLTIETEASQCGVATVGIGKEMKGSGGYYADIGCSALGGTAAQNEIILPPVNQGNAPNENDNHLLFEKDTISDNKNSACFGGFDGNGKESKACGPRELVIGTNSAVTLGGSVYSFCKLILSSNSSLYVAEGAKPTIYFDSPENCAYDSGVTQLELRSNSRITAAKGNSINLLMLFVGSLERETRVLLNSETSVDGPCEQNFVIYGPYTDIELDSKTKFCGALAGKTVLLHQNAQVWTSSEVNNSVLPNTAPHYVHSRFLECTATAVSGAPDEGC